MYIAISAAGAFRTVDGGKSWKPINKGLRNEYLPDPNAEVGHCVHHMVMHPKRPDVLYMQLHQGGGVLRTDNAGDEWRSVNGNLPTDFGFPIDVHAHEPETIYVVPMNAFPGRYAPEGKLRVWRSKNGRQRMGADDEGLAAGKLLRQRAARRHGRRFAGFLRSLLRHHGRASVLLAGRRRQLDDGRA